MAAAGRHVYGPRPLSALVPGLTRPAFKRRAPAATQVLTDWAAIVGPALADVTAPRRFQGGTLAIACSGAIALELQHLSGELIARINTALGRATVERLRFVQEPLAGRAAAVPPPRAAPPAAIAAIGARVADVPGDELRTALARLGEALAAEYPSAFQPTTRPSCD